MFKSEPTTLKHVKSFGNSSIVGIPCVCWLHVKYVVVDNKFIKAPLLIGQDVYDQSDVIILKDSKNLNYYSVTRQLSDDVDPEVDKVNLRLYSESKMKCDSGVNVTTEPSYGYDGDLIVESKLMGMVGNETMVEGEIY